MNATCRLMIVLCALGAPARALAQPLDGGARSAALGGAGGALAGDTWGRSNPAVRGALHQPSISLSASQAYGMAELRLGAAEVLLPFRAGAFAMGAQTFGFEQYRENRFFAGYARGVRIAGSRVLYAGLDVHYVQVQIEGYGSAGTPALSAGLLAQVLPQLWAGLSVVDLAAHGTSLSVPIERRVVFGLQYEPAARVRLLLDAVRYSQEPLCFRSGVEVAPIDAIAFRAGMETAPVRLTAGIGLRAGKLAADVAVAHHEVLGWTPGLSLGVTW